MTQEGLHAVVYVVDLDRTSEFYAEVAGLEVLERVDGDYAVLAGPAYELSLVVVPADVAAGIELTDPPQRREEVPVKLSFPVASLDDAAAAAASLGGAVDGQRREFRGWRHCHGADPEGNVISVREPVGG
jgi:predicted enzyme related to lactoylglutathione lyase